MPTSSTGGEAVSLFLFAHQDDEFGVFQQILDERSLGRRVACAYLTDGEHAGVAAGVRNRESLQVLRELGVGEHDVLFAGERLGIADGTLPERLAPAEAWLRNWLASVPAVAAVYVPAWEGGHQDHDSLHALAVQVMADHGFLERTRQFALYNGYRCPGPFFTVLSPLAANGPVFKTVIPWRNRVRFLRFCISYRSQAKSWLGLLPFVLGHYLADGCQSVQPVDTKRLLSPPHQGRLYYETRGFYTWGRMSAMLRPLLERR